MQRSNVYNLDGIKFGRRNFLTLLGLLNIGSYIGQLEKSRYPSLIKFSHKRTGVMDNKNIRQVDKSIQGEDIVQCIICMPANVTNNNNTFCFELGHQITLIYSQTDIFYNQMGHKEDVPVCFKFRKYSGEHRGSAQVTENTSIP